MKTKLGLNKAQKSTHQSLTKPFGKKFMSLVLCICMLIGVLATMPSAVYANVDSLNLLWPIKNYYRVDSGFGIRSWDGRAHNGIDIFRPCNTPIYAAQSGTAVATYHSSWGNNVLIDHGNGYKTRYAHMNKFAFSGSKWVEKGEVIGYVGKTGSAAGYHLHFELYQGPTRINPVPVNYDGRHSFGGSAPCTQAVRYVYDVTQTVTEPVHTHSWNYNYDSGHPHNQYRSCSCGAKEYTGSRQNVAGCANCFPVGNVSLTRSFNKVNGTATFYRNSVENAHSYTLTLYRDGYQYGNYNMSGRSYSVSGLAPGNYSAELTARNNNTGRTRKGYCSNFKIVNTYNVSFNANGGSNAPSAQTKIQNEWLTLSSSKPNRSHYIFKGWASSRTASEPQYQPGGTYDKNAKITLYAVWEPEVYTVNFDADGGKGDVSDRTITYGDTMKMPNGVIKDGYYLKGWATKKGATDAEYKFGVDYKIDKNLSLYAVWGNSTWTEEVASSFAGGDGTEQNPYRISNAAELAYLAKIVNTQSTAAEYKYYVLTDNINLGYSEWTPIGIFDNENQYFCGSLDGNGYTISDLYISNVNANYIGLFGRAKDSTFKNITLAGTIEGINTTVVAYIGGMCGYTEKTDFTDCNIAFFNISNLTVGTSGYSSVGCLAGNTDEGNIMKCRADECSINLKSGEFYSGIMVGDCNTKISDCEVKSTESGLFSTSSNVDMYAIGGLCGYMNEDVETCSVSAPYFANTLQVNCSQYGMDRIGGLCGYATATVRTSSVQFSDGPIKTIDGGDYKSSIYASGDEAFIGGITGYSESMSEIIDCKYNGQSLTGISKNRGMIIGGLVGRATSPPNATASREHKGYSTIKYREMPTKDGYKAIWYTNPECTNQYMFGTRISEDLILYPKWEKRGKRRYWNGTSKEPEYNTDTKTYIITTGEELAWISDVSNGVITTGANYPADKSFKGYNVELGDDIYLNENWSSSSEWGNTPPPNTWKRIGSFSGTFNGKGYTIYGMYKQGLFGTLTAGKISGVDVDCLYINEAAVVDYIDENSVVENCEVTGSYRDSRIYGNDTIGGIARKNYGEIKNCINFAPIYGRYQVGGIVGENNGKISDCHNYGDVSGNSGDNYYSVCIGGIVGENKGYGASDIRIVNCSNSGYVYGVVGIGGIVGKSICNKFNYIEHCFNKGPVYGSYRNGTWNCSSIGGIIGESGSGTSVYDCYNVGGVGGSSSYSDIGGIIGHQGYSDSFKQHGWISRCYNIGNVTGNSEIGEIAGYNNGYVRWNYYSGSNSVVGTNDYSAYDNYYKSSSNMKNLSNLSRLGESDWAVNSNYNDGYPYLKSIEYVFKTYSIKSGEELTQNDTIKRSFANVDGILYGEGSWSKVGGLAGVASGSTTSVPTARIKGSLSVASKINANTTGKAYKGYIVGNMYDPAFDISSTYYGSDVELPNNGSNDVINTAGTARATRLMKMPSFLKNQLGLGEYISVENLKENPEAVWVIRDGQLPELYYNCLNDITVSKDIENGAVTVDKTQAVDGETVTITATPNDGYELNKVYVNGTEIDGTAFEMSGASDVYATFKPITPEYNVKVQTDSNAAATLVNMDKDSGGEISLMSVGDTELTARDGEEIKVNASAIDDYTVDGVYVNGEEIAADSFIVTDNSTVSLDVQSLSTDVKAVTNDAEDISYISAVLSGKLEDDSSEHQRYILYWADNDPDTVYTTEVSEQPGEYKVEVQDLLPGTAYSFKMTENGNVKSFKTLSEDSDGDGEPVTPPQKDLLTTTVCTKTVDGYHFDITADESITDEIMVAIYNADDMVIDIKYAEVSGGKAAVDTTQSTAKYAKIFVWESGMKPKAAPERVTVQ